MKKNKTYDWKSLEANLSAGLEKQHTSIQLQDTPFYPLAFHTEMPENVAFENGHLSFRFKDFTWSALNKISLDADSCKYDGNQINIGMRLDNVALKAKYEINTKYANKITLDTGGNMRELDESSSREAGASDSGVEPLSPTEIDAMVTQARDQKEPIQGTLHGPTLMSTYNEHTESYNTAFVTSSNLRTLWAAGGSTTQMSRDTHDSLDNNTVVNSPTKVYANGLTYNFNAASQQTNVSIALTMMAIQAKKEGNTALEAKYRDAAKAAAGFKETVNDTGDGTQPANMTGDQVYSQLNDPKASVKQVSDEQFRNMLDQANDEDSKEGGADEEAVQNGWRILRGDERKMIRERMFLFQEELLAIKGIEPELLWAGDCYAELKGTEASITLTYDGQKSVWKVTDSEVRLPGFSIEVDDSFWSGKTADIVRERLANIHFVKSLLQSKIQSSIQNILERVAVQSISVA